MHVQENLFSILLNKFKSTDACLPGEVEAGRIERKRLKSHCDLQGFVSN